MLSVTRLAINSDVSERQTDVEDARGSLTNERVCKKIGKFRKKKLFNSMLGCEGFANFIF